MRANQKRTDTFGSGGFFLKELYRSAFLCFFCTIGTSKLYVSSSSFCCSWLVLQTWNQRELSNRTQTPTHPPTHPHTHTHTRRVLKIETGSTLALSKRWEEDTGSLLQKHGSTKNCSTVFSLNVQVHIKTFFDASPITSQLRWTRLNLIGLDPLQI